MNRIEQLRAALAAACDTRDAAYAALDAASEDADIDALSRAFGEAQDEVDRLKENLRKAEEAAQRVADSPKPAEPEPAVVRTNHKGQVVDDDGLVVEPAKPDKQRVDVQVGREPRAYEDPEGPSYLRDLLSVELGTAGPAVRARLDMHARQAAEFTVERSKKPGARFSPVVRYGGLTGNLDLRTGLSSITSGSGAEFVPPVWLNEDYIRVLRPGRATADAMPKHPLPPNTTSINFPKLATGSTTASQADNANVSETTPTTGAVTIGVQTIAGQVTVSQQEFDRAIPNMDRVIFTDLLADYDKQTDIQVINGNGTQGTSGVQLTGLLNVSGIGTVTYNSGSWGVGGGPGYFYSKILGAVNTVATARFETPNLIVMHPQRWFAVMAASDTAGRPLVLPRGYPGFNDAGFAQVAAQSYVGDIGSIPVIIDANVPTNLTVNAQANTDPTLVLYTPDMYLMEDMAGPYMRVMTEVLSNQLAIRLQLFNYVAFASASRYPSGTCLIEGSVLTAPSF